MSTRYHRPARWARTYDIGGTRRLAVGLAGRPPSREARMLAAAPNMGGLPAGGVWHTSDWATGLLAAGPVEMVSAIHQATGAHFRLLRQPGGQIISISAEDDAAIDLASQFWSDPSSWANRQAWTIATT